MDIIGDKTYINMTCGIIIDNVTKLLVVMSLYPISYIPIYHPYSHTIGATLGCPKIWMVKPI